MSYGLGIDVGTIFTRAAVGSHGQTRIVAVSEDDASEPPVVESQPDGDLLIRRSILVRGGGNGGTRLAEPVPLALGGQDRHGVPRLARALRSVLDTATAAQREAPERVVLTCPAIWGPVRRRQLVDASRQVGLDEVTVLSEPEAATAFFVGAQRLAEADVVLVYDLGAVRTDLTVVRVTRSGTEILGQPEALAGVGGIDVDDVVLAYLDRVLGGALSDLDPADPAEAAMLEAARASGIRSKEALSQSESTVVALELPAGTFRVSINRTLFEPMIRAGLESTLTAARRSIASAGVEPADLAAVVLVGGSSRIPLVGRMLAAGLRRPVLTDEYPQHCVTLGAAEVAGRSPALLDDEQLDDELLDYGRPGDGQPGHHEPGTANPGSENPGSPRSGNAKLGNAKLGTAKLGYEPPDGEPRTTTVTVSAPMPAEVPSPGPATGTRRRWVAIAAALGLLVGWTTYVALVPLIEAPDPEVTFAADRGTSASLDATSSATGSSGNRAAGPSTLPRSSTGATLTASSPPLTATSTRKPGSSRAGTTRAERGTGRLIGLGGRCLDVRGGRPTTGSVRVQAVTCRSTSGQIWTATANDSLRAYGRCLEATGSSAGARLVASRCDAGAAQQWRVLSGRIENPNTHTCVQVNRRSDGKTRVVTATCRAAAVQTWTLKT